MEVIQGFFENEIPSDGKTLIFDMKALDSLNSVIWDQIVALLARLKKSGGNVILCGMHGQAEQSFRVLELGKLFVSYPSAADALEVSAKKNHADSLLQGSVPSSFEGDGLAVPVFLSLEEKIRHIVAHNPEQGVRAIARLLRSDAYGRTKIGTWSLFVKLRSMNLGTKKERYRFYRSM
jgi:anti-anti-sigma regulatory factor